MSAPTSCSFVWKKILSASGLIAPIVDGKFPVPGEINVVVVPPVRMYESMRVSWSALTSFSEVMKMTLSPSSVM